MTFFYTDAKDKYKDGYWTCENILPYLYSYGSDGKYRKTKMTIEKIKDNKDYEYSNSNNNSINIYSSNDKDRRFYSSFFIC